jgi:hypothetical protein
MTDVGRIGHARRNKRWYDGKKETDPSFMPGKAERERLRAAQLPPEYNAMRTARRRLQRQEAREREMQELAAGGNDQLLLDDGTEEVEPGEDVPILPDDVHAGSDVDDDDDESVLTVQAADSSDDESGLDGMNDDGSETESDDDDAEDHDDDDVSGEEDVNSDTGLAPSGSPNNSRGHVLDEGADAAREDRNAADLDSVGRESDDGDGDGQFDYDEDGSQPGDHETAAAFGNLCGAARDDAANWAEDANEQRTGALYAPSTEESEDDNSAGLMAAAPMDGSLLRRARGNGNDDDNDSIGNHDVEDEGDDGYGPDGINGNAAPSHCEERHEPPTAGVLDNGDPGEAFLHDGDVFFDAECGTENGVYDIEIEVDRGSTSGGRAVPPDALAGAHPTTSAAGDAAQNQARPKRQYGSSLQQRSDRAAIRQVKPRR